MSTDTEHPVIDVEALLARIDQAQKQAEAQFNAVRSAIRLHHDVNTGQHGDYHACAECGDGVPDSWPCQTLLALASPYAD